jgi:hypothetical protein
MSLPGLMKHVRILETAQVVTTESVAARASADWGPEPLQDATAWIEQYRARWERRLDRPGRYIEKTEGADLGLLP